MSKRSKKPKKPTKSVNPPDGRGTRPTDPNELAAWIVKQTTDEPRDKRRDRPGRESDEK